MKMAHLELGEVEAAVVPEIVVKVVWGAGVVVEDLEVLVKALNQQRQ